MNDFPNDELLIVGLGNPGPEYAGTRHNLGRLCVQDLGERLGVQINRRRWRSLVGTSTVEREDGGNRQVWLVLPQTFMNLSGRAVAEALRDLGLGPHRLWVVYDELDLPFCRLRIRTGGSAAGHNGMRSIIASLKTQDFARFRVGVGRPHSESVDPVAFLLSRFSRQESAQLPTIVSGVARALEHALRDGLEPAMAIYNRAGSLDCEPVV